MASRDTNEQLKQMVRLLQELQKPKATVELLDEFGSRNVHPILKLCVEKGHVSRKRQGHRILNTLTPKGRKTLELYKELEGMV